MSSKNGIRAIKLVAELLSFSSQRRQRLREAGWKRVISPPLVGNQWLWQHPEWHVQLEDDAIRILETL